MGTGKVFFIRSFIYFGAPLDIDGIRYNDVTDRNTEQVVHIQNF